MTAADPETPAAAVLVNGEPPGETTGSTGVRWEDQPNRHAYCDGKIRRLRDDLDGMREMRDVALSDAQEIADANDLLREQLAAERAERLHRTGERDAARSDLARTADAAKVVLDLFTRGSDGWRARISGVNLMRAYKAIGRPVPDHLAHLEGQ